MDMLNGPADWCLEMISLTINIEEAQCMYMLYRCIDINIITVGCGRGSWVAHQVTRRHGSHCEHLWAALWLGRHWSVLDAPIGWCSGTMVTPPCWRCPLKGHSGHLTVSNRLNPELWTSTCVNSKILIFSLSLVYRLLFVNAIII